MVDAFDTDFCLGGLVVKRNPSLVLACAALVHVA